MRDKDRELRNWKKAELQLKVADDSLAHTQQLYEKIKSQVSFWCEFHKEKVILTNLRKIFYQFGFNSIKIYCEIENMKSKYVVTRFRMYIIHNPLTNQCYRTVLVTILLCVISIVYYVSFYCIRLIRKIISCK